MALLSAPLVESLAADAVAELEVEALVVEAAFVEVEAAEVAVEEAEPETVLLISARTVALKVPVMPVKLFGFRVRKIGSKRDERTKRWTDVVMNQLMRTLEGTWAEENVRELGRESLGGVSRVGAVLKIDGLEADEAEQCFINKVFDAEKRTKETYYASLSAPTEASGVNSMEVALLTSRLAEMVWRRVCSTNMMRIDGAYRRGIGKTGPAG